MKCFKRVIKDEPQNAQAYYYLAMSAKYGDQDDQVVKYLDSAIKYRPDYYKAYQEKASQLNLSIYEKMMCLRKMMELNQKKDDWVWGFRYELI